MKILLIVSVAGNGGSSATAFHNAKILNALGHETILIAPGTYWLQRGAAEGVRVENFLRLRRGARMLDFYRDACALRKFVKIENVHAVLVQKSPEQWIACTALRGLKNVAFVRLRGVVFPISPNYFNRKLHHAMDLVVCSASCIARHFGELPGFGTERVRVLQEGIDPERFKPASAEERTAARASFELPAEALIIGTAGRPSPVKGHDLLVRAFGYAMRKLSTDPSMQERLTKTRLCIFSDESRRGPGSYHSLEALCAETGFRENILLRPGHLADMRLVYRALDVYVLPSRGSEGSSRAGLEACASGLPLLASAVGVLPDLVQNGVTGRLLPSDNREALGEALAELIASWPEAKTLGVNARKRIENELSERRYGTALVGLLEEAIAYRQRRS